MISPAEWTALLVVALLGHLMAEFWCHALRRRWPVCARTIFDLPIDERQLRRERRNARHAPLPAVILLLSLTAGAFSGTSWVSFGMSLLVTTVWAEVWHYASHRAMHRAPLLAIHREHHASHLNTPYTALSFSFPEKLLFDTGLLVPLTLLDRWLSLNVFGIVAWYAGYLVINGFSHANFEIKSQAFLRSYGRLLTTTTYHALHHSRYVGNYGLGTRVLDRCFGTEWEDYERVYVRVVGQRQPLTRLSERVDPVGSPARATGVGPKVPITRERDATTGSGRAGDRGHPPRREERL